MHRTFMRVLILGAVLAPSAAAEQWVCAVERNHSTVGFSVPIVAGMTRVTGKFTDYTVDIVYDDADLTLSSVNVRIQVASINTGIGARDKDLQGPKFFDAANHPEIVFQSRTIEKQGDAWRVHGDLTMRGVTRPVELKFVITRVIRADDGRPVLGVSARSTLNRQDFKVGSDWRHTAIPNFIGDEIGVEIDLWTRAGRKRDAPPAEAR